MESGQGRRAEHHLVVRVDGVSGEDRRPEVGVGPGQQRGDGEAVELNVAERVPGPGRHFRIPTEEMADSRRDVIAPRGVDGVAPIPPVEGGVGVERCETVPEGEGGDQDCHREHGTRERGADGHGSATAASLEGEAQAGERRFG